MTSARTPSKIERGKRTPGKRRLEDSESSPSRKRPASSSSASPPLQGDAKRISSRKSVPSIDPTVEASPAYRNMYHFESSKSKPIDLTSSPPNGFRKPSFSQHRPPSFNPHQGPKKLFVKNLQSTPTHNAEAYLEKIWTQEDKALTASFNDDKIPYSLEELYRGAENVCRQGKAAELYSRLRRKCDEHISDRVAQELRRVARNAESPLAVLKTFVNSWSKWQRQLLTIRQIFFYMDQTYLLRSLDNPSITETGRLLFKHRVFDDEILKHKTMRGVIDLVDADRRVRLEEDDSSLLRRAIDTMHELTIYSSDFEPSFRDASETYYRKWRQHEAEIADLGHYASTCSNFLGSEMVRCDLFALDRTTRNQLSDLFDTIFVHEKLDFLTDQESVLDLLEADKSVELEQVYTLLQRQNSGEMLGPSFDRFVEDEGTAIVFDDKNEADMVINLLNFKRRLDHFLKFSFHGNDNIANGLHKSFGLFMNKTKKSSSNWDTSNNKPGEMIAKHVDLLLKGGVKAVPKLASKVNMSKVEEENDFDDMGADEDAEINLHLSNALDLFRFVQGKAVFEAFYKKDLARRLLMGRSASNDAERAMLTRLKNECGASFTHNLESMFKDMDLARDEMASYNQLLDDRGKREAGPDLHVNVLSAAAWPTYPDVPVNIPSGISQLMNDFEAHYHTKHSGRKLTWKHALSHCQLKAKFPRGNKEIVVSGFQAIVLLLFNDLPTPDAHLGYTAIQAATGLSDIELRRTLQSLACAKYRVLTKHPRGREVNNSDTFTFNAAFVDPKMRIKINQIQLKETKEENKETHKRVAEDRHFETQAAIVRIMKSRKVISHNDLIIEVIKATMSRGVLDQADIKKNIEK